MSANKYREFHTAVRPQIPDDRLITDPMRTLVYGTDASFYRLVPKMVIKALNEGEVAFILKQAQRLDVPVTFRAAGTSLSGQAVTDSVLVVAGGNWKNYEILEQGDKIRLQPGIIGAQANRYLASYGRKIGPDPASINAAMIGGIAANNASGMCCGTAQNSYQTVSSLRLITHDGTLLDTGDPASRQAFEQSHGGLVRQIAELGRKVRSNTALSERIRDKFKIKNTTGYSLNALVDFEDPFDIITHLMIGSEGTLGFISEIVYDTVVEHPHKASTLMLFNAMHPACTAAAVLKSEPVAAVELMDRAALRSVENKAGMPSYLKTLSEGVTALLVETRASDPDELKRNTGMIEKALSGADLVQPIAFTDQVAEYTRLWNIRKGLFPSVGAVRPVGTTVIIEDVAFPIGHLAEAGLHLQELFAKYHYSETIIFGHALEGNLHFVFPQDFSTREEVERYRQFMDEVCRMVVDRFDGSLKAEHGTGRNMAPYVEMEWGREAYELMTAVKRLLDPHNLLNPGVILNSNPNVHIENLKPLPQAHPLIDKCTECGFCEATCPSRNLTLTPRQRIVARREIGRLKATGEDPARLRHFEADYSYQGEATCAADGLCAVNCPIDINTGQHTKTLRSFLRQHPSQQARANWAADHFGTVTAMLRAGLRLADLFHGVLGSPLMIDLAQTARKFSRNRLPLWNKFMPTAVDGPTAVAAAPGNSDKVVYFPSCAARTMGPAVGDPDQKALYDVTQRLIRKGGYDVIYPPQMRKLCCGMAFESKGFLEQADRKAGELEKALGECSRGGRYPVLFDTSPCLYRMRQFLNGRMRLYDPAEFVLTFLMERLTLRPVQKTVALHSTCSTLKMGLDAKLLAVAEACAARVVVPEEVKCCGFAGDRGFNYPELNASALNQLDTAVAGCSAGYSTSRTCEIGLSLHSGLHYKSILYLVDRCAEQ